MYWHALVQFPSFRKSLLIKLYNETHMPLLVTTKTKSLSSCVKCGGKNSHYKEDMFKEATAMVYNPMHML